jgi:dTDP-4-amino-4,6-dideoxyglucose formyltransferase
MKKKVAVFSDNKAVLINFLDSIKKLKIEQSLFDFYCSFKYVHYFSDLECDIKPIDFKKTSLDSFQNYYLILSVHSQQIFPKWLVENIKSINIHPGFLPDTRGVYPGVFSILFGLRAGVTIHIMTSEIDVGPVLIREEIRVEKTYNSSDLYSEILKLEKEMMIKYLDSIINDEIQPIFTTSSNDGYYFSKDDFNKLKKIDLNKNMSVGKMIDYLRAMSHEGYENCYYVNENEKKVFVEIKLRNET